MSVLRINTVPTREGNSFLLNTPLQTEPSGQSGLDSYVSCQNDGFITRRQLRKAAERIGENRLNTKDVLLTTATSCVDIIMKPT